MSILSPICEHGIPLHQGIACPVCIDTGTALSQLFTRYHDFGISVSKSEVIAACEKDGIEVRYDGHELWLQRSEHTVEAI